MVRGTASRGDVARPRSLLAAGSRFFACVLAVACVQCATPPERAVSMEDALALSRRDESFLVVAFGAEWCAPCRRMEDESWSDARIQSWFDAHGRFARVDLDRDPRAAEEHAVSALPTLVAFRGGREVDRVHGYRDPDAVLDWLDGLEAGATELDRLAREQAKQPESVRTALALASAQLDSGRPREAANLLARWWDPSLWTTVDVARLATLTTRAAEAASARPPFVAQLEALELRLDDDRALEAWLRLASALGEHERAARWFTALEDPIARKEALAAARAELWTSLRAVGRRDAIVHLVELSTPAVAFAANQAVIPAELRADPSVLASLRAANRERLVDLEAGLVELGRSEDAARVRAARWELERP